MPRGYGINLPKKGSNGSLKSNAQKRSSKLIAHRTRGSVLDELNMSEQEVLELKLKADLHQDILKLIKQKKFTPRQLEKLFDIPQPRVSELLRGKLSLLSVSKLLYYAHLLGAHVHVKLKKFLSAHEEISSVRTHLA
ncbi:MAG TPA: XRE family transcriptional regulator [Candidatus Angelobacter sp.]